MKIKQALMLTLLICVGEVNAAQNINPWMTFGDFPVVGVLGQQVCTNIGWGDTSPYCTSFGPAFTAGYVTGDSCPEGTAAITVNGFNFSQYNGWNGLGTGYGCDTSRWWMTCSYSTYKTGTLCVVPK
jgi:hypothetical protein